MLNKEKLSAIIKDKYLILDGATGTELQKKKLDKSVWQYEGKNYQGIGEMLNLSKPEIMEAVHIDYLNAGADIIKTNTFGALPWVLKEEGVENYIDDILTSAVKISKSAINKYRANSKSNREIFIAGSVGPGTKLPTLGNITFDEMYEGYKHVVRILIDSGIDMLLFETAQDPLQLKAAVIATRDVNIDIPIMLSVTIEKEGTMLVGTDIETAYTILSSLDIFSFGLNCGTGPDIAKRHLEKLASISNIPISIHSNAGLPENRDGNAYYSMTASEFSSINVEFTKYNNLRFLGGCCGTSPNHIKELATTLATIKPRELKANNKVQSIASLFSVCNLRQEPAPLLIGERANASGSKIFRELLLKEDLDGCINICFNQVKGGSHAIDLNVAWSGRDEVEDMKRIASLYARTINAPLVIDSIKPEVMESALKVFGGRAIINSANLEQGEKKFDQICRLAKRYGSTLVCLTIDEKGMATTCERKVEIVKRMYDRATKIHGLKPEDLLFDTLTFTVASGEESSFSLARETINSIKEISILYPECGISLGVSNISYGLKEEARIKLNSVFLSEAVKHGLTTAIINVLNIIPLNKITDKEVELALKLIYNEENSKEPLLNYINYYTDKKDVDEKDKEKNKNVKKIIPLEEAIKNAFIDGQWSVMEELLNKANTYEKFGGVDNFATHIINQILLPAMADIGVLFASGKMQLPFVLGSAEVMKKSVAYLQKYMKKEDSKNKKTIILGTVAGDVHDVGKNLVDILLTNNGYNIINIGTKVGIELFISEYKKYNADYIGMSGLLVKSTEIMKENLELLRSENINIPVLLGGAALTRDFVEKNCRVAYGNDRVYYCKDAFDAIDVLKK